MSNGMPEVWLSDKSKGKTWWTPEGVDLHFHAILYIEGMYLTPVEVKISGLDTPNVIVVSPSEKVMDDIPDSMGQVHNWVYGACLVEQWQQEVDAYKEVMSQVDMDDLIPSAGARCLSWTLTLAAPGAAPLELGVTVAAGWVGAVLRFITYDGEFSYHLCAYEVGLPITLIDLKARVRETLMDYMP